VGISHILPNRWWYIMEKGSPVKLLEKPVITQIATYIVFYEVEKYFSGNLIIYNANGQ
jgi:hypothetical protein